MLQAVPQQAVTSSTIHGRKVSHFEGQQQDKAFASELLTLTASMLMSVYVAKSQKSAIEQARAIIDTVFQLDFDVNDCPVLRKPVARPEWHKEVTIGQFRRRAAKIEGGIPAHFDAIIKWLHHDELTYPQIRIFDMWDMLHIVQ